MINNEVKFHTNGRKSGVSVIVAESYEALSKRAASIVAGAIAGKSRFVLGLATGTSPLGLYSELAELNAEGRVDFSGVITYNLDEYYPISPENSQSYRYFMNKNLFEKINIDIGNTHLLNGRASDCEEECAKYDDMIEKAGGIDLQVLGIGNNGHIGFNEPGESFVVKTHIVELADSTREANSRLFKSKDEVPHSALSMGIGSIMRAKQIVLVANGRAKAEAVKAALEGPITPQCQASVLQLHPNVVFILDKEAAGLLTDYKAI